MSTTSHRRATRASTGLTETDSNSGNALALEPSPGSKRSHAVAAGDAADDANAVADAKRAKITDTTPTVEHSAAEDGSDGTLSTPAARSSTPSEWATSPPTAPGERHHPNFYGVDHVPVDVLTRSLDFIQLADGVHYRYGLNKVPLAARWGNRYESEKYLCINNQRITVWLVGVLKSKWFTGEGGAPAARVSVGLHLAHDGDLDALHDIYKKSHPTPTKLADRAFASCFQTRRPKGSNEPVNLPFDRIYNATEKLLAKSKMPKVPHSHLGKGDYLLVEAWVNRYKTAGDKKVFGDWTDWMVSLELRELSVLFAAPDGYIDDEDAPPADIEDDM